MTKDWEKHRSEIIELYGQYTLEVVMQEMSKRRQFNASYVPPGKPPHSTPSTPYIEHMHAPPCDEAGMPYAVCDMC